MNSNFNSILYKLVVSKKTQKLYIIFALNKNTTFSLSDSGKKVRNTTDTLYAVDVLESASSDDFIFNTMTITDVNKVLEEFEVVSHSQYEEILSNVLLISGSLIAQLLEKAQLITKCNAVIKNLLKIKSNNGSDMIMINHPDGNLANIVFKTVTGKKIDLSDNDIEKVANVILEVLNAHVNMDISDGDQVNKLKNELEYKVIEAMPKTTRAGNITIDMDYVLKEIKDIQESDSENE